MNTRRARDGIAGRGTPPHDETRSIYHYLRVLRDRRWPLLGVVGASLLLALLATYLLPSQYRAVAMVQIEPEREDFYGSWRRTGTDEEYQSHYLTQVETLTSNGLARRIIDDLDLWEHEELTPWWRRRFALADDENALVERFRERISVSTLLGSTLVNVAFEASDPRFASRVLNALVERFTKEHVESKRELTIRASDWMSEKIPVLNSSVAEAEARLDDFRRRHGLIHVDGSVSLLSEVELAQASEELAKTRSELAEAVRIFEEMSDPEETGERLESLELVRNDSLIQLAWALKSKALNKRNALAERYGPKHPRMIDANTRLASLDVEIGDQIDRVMDEAARRVESLDRQLSQAEGRLEEGSRDALSVQTRRLEMRSLEREMEMQRELADQFIVDTVAARALDGFDIASASVIDHAVPPPTPHRPQRLIVLALVALSAGIFSVLFVFVRDFLDDRVRSTEDVRRKLGMSLLGVMPDIGSAGMEPGSTALPIEIDAYRRSEKIAEMVNTIRTALITDPRRRVADARVLLVGSSVEHEGRSTVAINLAHSFSRLDRVLLIDCHLRRPVLEAFAGGPDEIPGLNTLVAGESSVEDSIRRDALGERFDVLPSLRDPDGAVDVLGSDAFEQLLTRLRERYAWIVLDAAPTQRDSSSLILGRLADAVLYVVESDGTSLETASRGIARIRDAGGYVAGVLINRVDLRKVVSWRGDHDYASYCGEPAYRAVDARRRVVDTLLTGGERVVETCRELDASALADHRVRWERSARELVRTASTAVRDVDASRWQVRWRAVHETSRLTIGRAASRSRDGGERLRQAMRAVPRPALGSIAARSRDGGERAWRATHDVLGPRFRGVAARGRDGGERLRRASASVGRRAVAAARRLPASAIGRLRDGSRHVRERVRRPDTSALRARFGTLRNASDRARDVRHERRRAVGTGGGTGRPDGLRAAPIPARTSMPSFDPSAAVPGTRRRPSVAAPRATATSIAFDTLAARPPVAVPGVHDFDGPVVIDADVKVDRARTGGEGSDRRRRGSDADRRSSRGGDGLDWLGSVLRIRRPHVARAAAFSAADDGGRAARRRRAVSEA